MTDADTIESLKAEIAAAREERDEARKAAFANARMALDRIEERDAERVANAGLREAIQRAVDFLFDSDDVEGRLRRDMIAALSAAPPNALTTEKQKDLRALRAASSERIDDLAKRAVAAKDANDLRRAAMTPAQRYTDDEAWAAMLGPQLAAAGEYDHPAPAPPNALRVGGVEDK